jgi:anti-sigma factor RsiW
VNCQDAQGLVQAYLDGELDLVRHLEIELHLRECPACARATEELQALRSALRAGPLRFEAPGGLRQRIRSSLRRAEPGPRAFPGQLGPWLLGVAAALVLAALGTGIVARFSGPPAPDEWLVREVMAAQARSLLGDLPEHHLTDIPSPDQHKVKPYLTRKLGFPPWVGDLETHNFHLIGGRLDYLNDRGVAAVVYKRREHYINLFMWPASREPDADPRPVAGQVYRAYHWTKAGRTYWAVSDLNDRELRDFVNLVQTNP